MIRMQVIILAMLNRCLHFCQITIRIEETLAQKANSLDCIFFVPTDFFYRLTLIEDRERDVLPPLTLSLRSGGFLFDRPDGLSIHRLSPRAPRFYLFARIRALFRMIMLTLSRYCLCT